MKSNLRSLFVGKKRVAGLAVLLLSVGLLAAALAIGVDRTAQAAESAQAQDLPSEAVAPDAISMPVTEDDLLEMIAKRAPGFGGMYVDPAKPDVLNIYLLDATMKDAAVAAINEFFGPGSVPAGGARVLQGQYSIDQLRAWYKEVRDAVWRRPTPVVSTDLAEQLNRIVVQVEDSSAIAEIRDRVSRTAAPSDAVVVKVGPRAVPVSHTLQSKFDPRQGGIQITANGTCTGGFVADRSGTKGFTTAHHCTATLGGVDAGDVYQPSSAFPPRVGVESIDPPFFFFEQEAACPPGNRCRWSDSSFMSYDAGIGFEQGIIAWPINALGSIEIDHNRPRLFITAEGSAVTVGTTIHKIGRSTGWSHGSVSSVCVDTAVGVDILYLCQTIVDAGPPLGGDSGAPVFRRPDDTSSNEATLMGLLWAQSGESFVYAKLNQVYLDLGSMASCVPASGC